ncbi:hypothetical protein RQP46_000252 [Phenoliferia psychrophenolica]
MTEQATKTSDATPHDGGAPLKSNSSMDSGAHHYLLCLDPSDTDASRRALEYTKSRLAQPGDLVMLLSVTSPPTPIAGVQLFSSESRRLELRDELIALENERLIKISQGFQPGVRVEHHAVIAPAAGVQSIVEMIVEEAQLSKCEIIITGRRPHGSLKERFIGSGSISTALLTNTNYSVLVVRIPGSPTPTEATVVDFDEGASIASYNSMEYGSHHYLLCLDPSDTDASKRALDYTKSRLAKSGDLVVLLSVTSPPAPIGGVSVFESENHRLELRAQLKELENLRLQEKCEIIITGRRPRESGALKRWVGPGSVSTALLTNTDYTVLIVR